MNMTIFWLIAFIVFAVGEGCEAFSDLNNNIEIPQKIRQLTGL